MILTAVGRLGIGNLAPNASLDVQGGGSTSATFSFGARNSAGTYALAVRDDGFVGIGTTSPSQALHVVGTICSTGGVTGCSDIRYKQNITPLSSSLSNILKIQGVNYFWRADEFPQNKFNKEKQIGFIAQDLEKIYPELVITDKEGYKSVDYSHLTPILVEAIKELKTEIDELTKQNLLQQEKIIKIELANASQQKDSKNLKAEIDQIKEALNLQVHK